MRKWLPCVLTVSSTAALSLLSKKTPKVQSQRLNMPIDSGPAAEAGEVAYTDMFAVNECLPAKKPRIVITDVTDLQGSIDASQLSEAQCLEKEASQQQIMDCNEEALTAEQLSIFHIAMDGASLFIGGNAGTGKSFLLREIARQLEKTGRRVAVTASTGMAALNLGGSTFHSTFGVPVHSSDCDSTFQELKQTVKPQRLSYDPKTLVDIDVVIVDEVSLLHAGYLETLDQAARKARKGKQGIPFGGIQVILSGDFMQLSPFGGANSTQWQRHSSDRFTCTGVESIDEASEGDLQAHNENFANSDENKIPTSNQKSEKKSNYWRRRADKGHKRKVTRAGPLKRRSFFSYYNQPMYESYAFREYLVHVQLREPTRHRQDPDFLQDLNHLRKGILTHRLSRSAITNPEDPAAVHLFATKRRVCAFNDRMMLSLPGPTRTFRTEVSLATENSWLVSSSDGSDSTQSSGTLSDVVLLHIYKKRSSICSNRKERNSARISLPREVAHGIVAELCKSVGMKLDAAKQEHSFIYVLPPSPYHKHTARMAVRFSAADRNSSAKILGRFMTSASAHARSTPLWSRAGGTFARLAEQQYDMKVGKQRHSGFLHSWGILRRDRYAAAQIASIARPAYQREMEKTVREDFALQSKVLKVGCRVVLLRNLCSRYVNGSLGTLERFIPIEQCRQYIPQDLKVVLPKQHNMSGSSSSRETAQLPLVRMDSDGELVAIPWILLPLPGNEQLRGFFGVYAVCMPLTPAYAFTVHRIQGITLDHSLLFDAADMFPCDHLVYVAASRVRRFSQLRIINLSPRLITVHKPSLSFSETLPTVEEAVHSWKQWQGGSSKEKMWFLPSWQKSVDSSKEKRKKKGEFKKRRVRVGNRYITI